MDHDRLRAALERSRQPWTVSAVIENASEPAKTKAQAAPCSRCDAPCESNEVCATVLARKLGLLEQVGRNQAYSLVEGAMNRLEMRGEARLRRTEAERPNTFIELED